MVRKHKKNPISIFVEQAAYKIHCNLVRVEKPVNNSNCVKLRLPRRNPSPPWDALNLRLKRSDKRGSTVLQKNPRAELYKKRGAQVVKDSKTSLFCLLLRRPRAKQVE